MPITLLDASASGRIYNALLNNGPRRPVELLCPAPDRVVILKDPLIRSGRPTPLLDVLRKDEPYSDEYHAVPRLGVSWSEAYANPGDGHTEWLHAQAIYDRVREQPGRPPKLSVWDMLDIVREYWGGFATQAQLAGTYNTSRQVINRILSGQTAWWVL